MDSNLTPADAALMARLNVAALTTDGMTAEDVSRLADDALSALRRLAAENAGLKERMAQMDRDASRRDDL